MFGEGRAEQNAEHIQEDMNREHPLSAKDHEEALIETGEATPEQIEASRDNAVSAVLAESRGEIATAEQAEHGTSEAIVKQIAGEILDASFEARMEDFNKNIEQDVEDLINRTRERARQELMERNKAIRTAFQQQREGGPDIAPRA